MNTYWVSWYSLGTNSEHELHSPWWRSGYSFDPDSSIFVALIRAESEDSVWEQIRSSYDETPQIEERFIEEMSDEEIASIFSDEWSDRFPKAKWMAWDKDRTCGCGQENCPSS